MLGPNQTQSIYSFFFKFGPPGSGNGVVLRHFLSRASTVFKAERNHLCNFGISHFGEHFYEIILNWVQWSRRRYH